MSTILIFIILLSRYTRKELRENTLTPQLNTMLIGAMVLGAVLFCIENALSVSRPFINWISYAMLAGLVYYIFSRKDLRRSRQVVFAVLPVLVVTLLGDITKLINIDFFDQYEDYFDVAGLFSFIWMGAMLISNNKQQKALEKERLKTEQKEKEIKASEALKAVLEVQVSERTAALKKQTDELQQTLSELKATQAQLIQSEKMASLGELTAGIAHEIQNPLNFVNNFSEINSELISEMKAAIDKGDFEEVKALAKDIEDNEQKIVHHGKRADAIVKGMLQHSRSSGGQKEPTDINSLADEYLRLAYHGLRAKDKSFNAIMKTDFDASLEKINVIPQDLGRVILNLITNAFYAVTEKRSMLGKEEKYEPTVTVSTKRTGDHIKIMVGDNGNGIPQKVLDKIYQPFFTTKPAGEGTGLGLSMSYDIITKSHGGELQVATKENEGSLFTINLPV